MLHPPSGSKFSPAGQKRRTHTCGSCTYSQPSCQLTHPRSACEQLAIMLADHRSCAPATPAAPTGAASPAAAVPPALASSGAPLHRKQAPCSCVTSSTCQLSTSLPNKPTHALNNQHTPALYLGPACRQVCRQPPSLPVLSACLSEHLEQSADACPGSQPGIFIMPLSLKAPLARLPLPIRFKGIKTYKHLSGHQLAAYVHLKLSQ